MPDSSTPVLTAASQTSAPKHTFTSVLKRLSSSVLVWLLVMLCAIDWVIVNVRPLQYWKDPSHTAFIPLDLNPVVSKLTIFFGSSDCPDVIVLGSSLPMTAISAYDEIYAGGIDNKDISQVRTYLHAKYLSDRLSQKLGHPITITNLSCVACMASDAYLILSKAISSGKCPHIVIYGIGPRDFIDNTVAPVGTTPAYELLSDWLCMKDFLYSDLPLDKKRDFLISQLWHYYAVRADYHQVAVDYMSFWLDRPLDLWSAEQASKQKAIKAAIPEMSTHSNSETKTNVSKGDVEASEYRSRYLPLNITRWKQELKYLDMLGKLCRTNKIELVVANMPITTANEKLLPSSFYSSYVSATQSITKRDGGYYVNLNDHRCYPDQNFADMVHLNASGGKRAQDTIVTKIESR